MSEDVQQKSRATVQKGDRIGVLEDLVAWKAARELTYTVYTLTRDGVFRRDQDLVRQMRRASVSIMANIAEGYGRHRFNERRQFLVIARGSLSELRSHGYVALDQDFCSKEAFHQLIGGVERVSRLVNGMIAHCLRQIKRTQTHDA